MRRNTKEFEDIYLAYYGEMPDYIVECGSIKVAIFKYALSPKSVDQINEFMAFRIKNGKTSKDAITKEDYAYLDNKLKNKRIYRQAVCVILNLSYNAFDLAYRTCGNLKDTLLCIENKKKPISPYKETITWEGETKTIVEWANYIKITYQQFRVRYINLGICKELFYPAEDFRKYINGNGAILTKQVESTPSGTKEWQSLSLKHPAKTPITEKEISTELASTIVTHLILDAKKDIMNKNQYSESAKKFLLNEDGQLEWLLSAKEGIDIQSAIKHLEQFVKQYESNSKKRLTSQTRDSNIYKQIAA